MTESVDIFLLTLQMACCRAMPSSILGGGSSGTTDHLSMAAAVQRMLQQMGEVRQEVLEEMRPYARQAVRGAFDRKLKAIASVSHYRQLGQDFNARHIRAVNLSDMFPPTMDAIPISRMAKAATRIGAADRRGLQQQLDECTTEEELQVRELRQPCIYTISSTL